MSPNIEGASNAIPGTYSRVETLQRGVSVPIGTRTALVIGEGLKRETLVSSAAGGGEDGFNSTYTTTTGSDGRHFLLGKGSAIVAPVIQNRTTLYRNGVQLSLLESVFTAGTAFDQRYDARLDYTTGQLELQSAYLVDQGGAYYRAISANVGTGTISNLTLVDSNTPAESWTVRCSSVLRDAYGNPIDGYAQFTAHGSVSGSLLDGYGNTVFWQSNGTVTSNSILSFSLRDGVTKFVEGDTFIIQTISGTLVAGESLVATYISTFDLEDPEFFLSQDAVVAKHGQPSYDNAQLSLGSQLTFANATPGVWAIQAKPPIPRRNSYVVQTSANGQADVEDLTFALPLNVIPDSNSGINFFKTNPTTLIETQIIPNKVTFYDPTFTANPSAFILGPYSYSYTVVLNSAVVRSGRDGVITVINSTTATFSSASVVFTLADLSGTRTIKVQNSVSNNGSFTITAVSNGVLTIYNAGGFTSESALEFLELDSSITSARILWTADLAMTLGTQLRATVVDTKDVDFYDAGWLDAFAAAERIETDIIVPLPKQTISVIFQNGKSHVEKMSNVKNRRERVLFIGAIQGLTPDNITGVRAAAVENIGILEGIQGATATDILAGNIEDLTDYSVSNAYGDTFRVSYFYPDQIIVNVSGTNVIVDGFYIAAAAAGYYSGNSLIAEPLTNKRLSGFTIDRSKLYAPIIQEAICAEGVTLLQPVTGGGRVIWAKTTTISLAAEEQEQSIIFIRDAIAKSVRRAFLPYIGRAETATLKATLFATANSAIQTYISQRLITQATTPVIQRDAVESRQWNVSFSVQPVYATNWIFIPISVGRLDQ